MKRIELRRAISLFILSTALTGAAMAQSIPPGGPGGGTGGGGTGDSYTTTTTTTIEQTLLSHNEGCCPDPIPCPAPTPTEIGEVTASVYTKLTYTQVPTFSTGLHNAFFVLTATLGFTVNPRNDTTNTPSTAKVDKVSVSCGSQYKVVKVKTVTTDTETRTYTSAGHPDETGSRVRKTEKTSLKSRIYGSLQNWDPITDMVNGSPCPPVRAEACESEQDDNF